MGENWTEWSLEEPSESIYRNLVKLLCSFRPQLSHLSNGAMTTEHTGLRWGRGKKAGKVLQADGRVEERSLGYEE